jgi:hypothetical protein
MHAKLSSVQLISLQQVIIGVIVAGSRASWCILVHPGPDVADLEAI